MYSSFFGFDIGRLSISIMMSRTENGRHTKRMSVMSSTRSMRITVRNVYTLPMENQKSIGAFVFPKGSVSNASPELKRP
jgi:hypothetical protein